MMRMVSMAKNNMQYRLGIKIIAWSFVPTVIILSAVAWFTFYSYQRVLGDLTIKQYPLIIQPEVQKINDALRDMGNKLLVPVILEIDTDHEASLEGRAQKILDYVLSVGAFDGGVFSSTRTELYSKHNQKLLNCLARIGQTLPISVISINHRIMAPGLISFP